MTEPVLEIRGLQAGYGKALVLRDITLHVGRGEPVAIIGRNGMGKTTLCATIMGLVRARGGSVTINGRDVSGAEPTTVARAGVAYVPQGRRLFPSLTVDEHLRMLAKGTARQPWNPTAVYDLFPSLASRKSNRGLELSGGEQQMLAIGRALLLNADLVVLDEPSEGLAPQIVTTVVVALKALAASGTAVLLVEQNLAAAAEVAKELHVLTNGRIEAVVNSQELLQDRAAQQIHLGVGARNKNN